MSSHISTTSGGKYPWDRVRCRSSLLQPLPEGRGHCGWLGSFAAWTPQQQGAVEIVMFMPRRTLPTFAGTDRRPSRPWQQCRFTAIAHRLFGSLLGSMGGPWFPGTSLCPNGYRDGPVEEPQMNGQDGVAVVDEPVVRVGVRSPSTLSTDCVSTEQHPMADREEHPPQPSRRASAMARPVLSSWHGWSPIPCGPRRLSRSADIPAERPGSRDAGQFSDRFAL
jgi:hypothetical protein